MEPHRAKKSLGQNFLVDPNLQRKIADAVDPRPDDELLEIGPGRGALTRHLVGRVRRLVLVELDDDLAAHLAADLHDDPSVEVVHADILDVDLDRVLDDPAQAKVVGNIPYNITTPILFHLLDRAPRPATIVLMIQREVADRILAPPGDKIYGALAIGVQTVAHVERVFNVGREAFRPRPDVDSTVIRVRPYKPAPLDPGTEAALRDLTRLAFGQRRKQFQKILRNGLSLDPSQIARIERATDFDLQRRPETFSPDEFILLTRALLSLDKLPLSR